MKIVGLFAVSKWVFMLIMLSTFNQLAIASNSTVSTAADREEVKLTIYNSNLALIKDVRKLRLNKGLNRLAFEDVSAKIQAETAILRSVSNPGNLNILEQNFDYDLLTPQKLLDKFIGKSIKIIRTNAATGKETVESATILSTNGGVVLQLKDRIETGIPGRLVFPRIPENLRSKPTLLVDLLKTEANQENIELSYLSKGLHWKADYIATIHDDEKTADLNAWVTLNNQSGVSFENANLQLVAGDVNQVNQPRRTMARMERSMSLSAATDAVQRQALFDYQLYTLPRKTHLANNQSKQVALFSAKQIPVSKSYVHRGQSFYYLNQTRELSHTQNAFVEFQFINNEKHQLGFPIPQGVVRNYKRDKDDNIQFIGEDHIDHIPVQEKITLKLGKAFDITIKKTQTDFKIVSRNSQRGMISESEYQLLVKNAKKNEIQLIIYEPIPGDWQMLSESSKHTKTSAHQAQWKINIPAHGASQLKYKVRIQH